MWIRFLKNKTLCSVYLLSLVAACSKNTAGHGLENANLIGNETSPTNVAPSTEGPVLDTGDAPAPPNTPGSNTASPNDILKSISGAWSSTCRDMDSKTANTSEKDIVIVTPEEKTNTITLYTLFYNGSRSCEKNRFSSLEDHSFVLEESVDGHAERNNALALDLIDGKISLEKPQNVLLVFANPQNSKQKGRILFEIFDTQRTGIRLQIQEWRSFLPSRMKENDAVLLQLESITNAGEAKDRNIPYTKSQAFSRSLADDLEVIEDFLRD
jgi:hypothetical protein